ncbi:SH3 domain-containing kinase-binding protein 1 isoform X3 [Hemicordylus capensis]|uniref:SH3 domain-containing kinase-binding protein 1 isoform X3 n=1 Tax=Hemicordylus capensis TaxID=884348 RepID=UPI002302B4E2|nr:SH3 domain-containing kinase-binding protein 1 isoform X3 [Hemicordylus capensis]XP_053163947.1 SH3 domain-containing kinase-binding protein 1 isoform X3 [Hemicordylus capensis]XP_053163948.1 SH3 domain-containing kinase-binding protein 1 isoform X3 [Hemicordylus capensis]
MEAGGKDSSKAEEEIKKDVKKESLTNKAPEKSIHEISNGSPLLLSETIIRTSKKGERNRRRRCQVAFSYMPQNEDELELKVGDIIEVVGEVEEGWWEGVLNGKTGMFPSNFIKELSDCDDAGTVLEEQLIKPRKSAFQGTILYKMAPTKIDSYRRYNSLRDATGSESDGGDSSSTKSEGANGAATIQPKKVKGIGFGDIFKDKPIKLRPRSIEVDNDFLPVEKTVGKRIPTATAIQEPAKIELDSRTKIKEYCKVIFPYEAQNEDELTIKEGDIVTLVNKDCIDAGWWEGELNGRRGVFPDNFVKLLPPDFEKERPKKPPPPSAPTIKQGSATTDRKHDVKKVPPERPECLPHRTEEKERPEREQKLLDLQKPSVPAIPPKKPRPPKTNSMNRPGTLPPRRPERPVVPMTHTRSDIPKVDLVGCTLSGTLEKDSTERTNDVDLEGFDSVVPVAEKLSHPTTTRPKATGRRPPSQSFTSSSLSSPDFFDSPSPEDEKEERISLPQKVAEPLKKTKTVTISLVSDNKASLPTKPGGLTSGSNIPSSLSSSSSSAFHSVSVGTIGHRSNSPSLFSTEGKPKTDHSSQGEAALEELRTQVKELRTIIETMKDQQKKEIKQLLSELDEEKKIRLRLQMEVNDIKKALQSK